MLFLWSGGALASAGLGARGAPYSRGYQVGTLKPWLQDVATLGCFESGGWSVCWDGARLRGVCLLLLTGVGAHCVAAQ